MKSHRTARASSLLAASVAIAAALGPCGCAGGAAERGAATGSSRGPSPGPRATDGIDDPGLAAVEADARGRGGDDGARAELRLLTDQVRAFVVAVVHAMPLGPTHAGASNEPRFDPPATLSRQLGSPHECEHGGDAHACAERLATRLLERINVLVPPHELASVKDSLLTAMAALEEGRVPVPTEVRWRVLREGEDPAAHLAQALTLVVISRHVGQCLAVGCSASQSGRLAAALAEELAIGPCSDALERVLAASDDEAGGRAAVAGMAHGECAPACANAALAGRSDEPFAAGANACRREHGSVAFAPFDAAAREITAWRTAARARLGAVEPGDPAVREVLQGRAELPSGTVLAMAPALFLAGDGVAFALPEVHDGEAHAVSGGDASVIVWVGRDGDAVLEPAPRFALDAPAPERTAFATSPLDGLHAALEHAEDPAAPGHGAPRAVALAANVPAPRIVLALAQAARGPEGPGSLVELAVRHGAQSRYIALRVAPPADAARVLRVSERQVTLIENGVGIRAVDLVPPTPGQPDTLNGAVPSDGAPVEYAIELEPDTTAATFVRVVDALAVAGGRANPTIVPALVPRLADDPVVLSVPDAAHASALRAAVESHRAEAMRCLAPIAAQAGAGDLGALPPRVDLHLVLDARGHATQATAASLSARDEHAAQCVQTAARRWRLPASGASAEVRAAYVLLAAPAPAVAAPAPPAPPAQARVH